VKTLFKINGGSHLYGLNTETSDIDIRYIFLNEDLGNTIGLDRFEHLDNRNSDEDKFGFELRHYMNLLRKTNTQVLELMYAPKEKAIICDEQFDKLVRSEKRRLLDTVKLYKSLKGYIFGEKRLANGERTGQLGGKRKAALEEYGFSPKNYTQLLRLCYCGKKFIYTNGHEYPVNIREYSQPMTELLMDIKTTPKNWTKEKLNKLAEDAEFSLDKAFEHRDEKQDLTFDVEYANTVLLDMYYPVLNALYVQSNGISQL